MSELERQVLKTIERLAVELDSAVKQSAAWEKLAAAERDRADNATIRAKNFERLAEDQRELSQRHQNNVQAIRKHSDQIEKLFLDLFPKAEALLKNPDLKPARDQMKKTLDAVRATFDDLQIPF